MRTIKISAKEFRCHDKCLAPTFVSKNFTCPFLHSAHADKRFPPDYVSNGEQYYTSLCHTSEMHPKSVSAKLGLRW